MALKTAVDAFELRLADAVVLGDVSAFGAGLAGVLWRHGDEYPALPRHFVFELPPKLTPALIEDGFVQS